MWWWLYTTGDGGFEPPAHWNLCGARRFPYRRGQGAGREKFRLEVFDVGPACDGACLGVMLFGHSGSGLRLPQQLVGKRKLTRPVTHLFNVSVQRLAQFGGQSAEFCWLLGGEKLGAQFSDSTFQGLSPNRRGQRKGSTSNNPARIQRTTDRPR